MKRVEAIMMHAHLNRTSQMNTAARFSFAQLFFGIFGFLFMPTPI